MIIPKQIILETTSRCNLRCRYCPSLDRPGRDMDWDLFKSIIDRINFPTVVIPWMNGEPLMRKDYSEIVKYISSKSLSQYVTTNGTIWNEDFFHHITGQLSTCYQLIFSLDGLLDNSPSIEAARPGSNRSLIGQNIFRLLGLKKSRNSSLRIATKICMRGQDWEEIERYIDFWLKKGVDYVCVGRNLTDDNTPGMRTSPCQYFDNNFMVIRADGELVACAYNEAVVNKHALPLGKVEANNIPLLDIYNNEAYTSLRESQNKGTYSGPCRTCGFAYTGMGFTGEVHLRDPKLLQDTIFFHQDYYNMFFSLKKDWKPSSYYERNSK
jgi:radical SAM protein with 4Fe4S-binding SPASM domain